MTVTKNPYRLASSLVPHAYRIFLTPDLENASFTGRVEIDVEVTERTKQLTLNAIELELGAASVTAATWSRRSSTTAMSEEFQTATYSFDDELELGPATVEIAFTGILNDHLRGFYRSTFHDEEGIEHTIATTQFESNDARRAFPCWDEPSFKATYEVTLTVPSHLAAFSNTSVVSDTDLGNGLRTVCFARTMKMSTYLVAFVVGPFEATDPVDVDGVPVRVIVPVGKLHLAPYALEVAEHALSFFTEYFNIAYPGDKYDLIAIPDFAAGAMENLGLVTFREADLLIDPSRASFAQIERVALVINHETAHMWFGDLVTMDWWEGIWLNEAFATFMEGLCTEHFRPQWNKWVLFSPLKDMAFTVDALHSTRAIEYEVVSPDDCRGMFDVLTYMKGCAVLRMIEQYLGRDVFRDGIRLYLRRHAYANTVTADLWRALEEASGQPVGDIMDTWILQGGFPLVSVNGGRLSQIPFSYVESAGESNIGHDWQIPVLSRTLGSNDVSRQLLGSDGAQLAASGVAVVNAGGTGFYRTAYSAEELAALAARLMELEEIERAGLFSDTWAAIMVGRSNVSDLFTLVRGLGDVDDIAAWTVVAQALHTINRIVDEEGRDVLAELVCQIARPQLDRLGWKPSAAESEHAGELRALIIDLLGAIGRDEAVTAEALRRFDANEVVGDLLTPILNLTVLANREGDLATFETRRANAPTPQEENAYLFAPAAVPDVASALSLLQRCFDDVRTQDAPHLIAALIRNRHAGAQVWRAFTKRYSEAQERFPSGRTAAAASGVATLFNDPALASEVRAFHSENPLAAGQRQVEQSLERMDVNLAFANRVRATLNDQLRAVVG
jgi:puromycin-sensitive aminopeptidase